MFFFWQLCWFAEHGYFRVRWLTTEWLGVVQRKDWVNTRLVDRLIVESIPGKSIVSWLSQYQVSWSYHCWVNTTCISSSFSDKTDHKQYYLVYEKNYKSSSNLELLVCVNMRAERLAVIYFDAVHRCSTHKNIIIFQGTKLGIFAYWAFCNPFDAVHIYIQNKQ